jgi:thiol-disulfide isomerase/thioredoxin
MAKKSFCSLRTICGTLLLIVCILALASAGWAAGKPAPDFTLKDVLQGKDYSLSQFKGKVVLLDFWGTWCGACRFELPKMKALHEAFGNDPRFAMIGLSVHDRPAIVQQFVQKNRLGWVQAAMGDPSKAWCVRLYQVQGYPTFYLIGKDGRVIASGHWADDLWLLVEAALDGGAGALVTAGSAWGAGRGAGLSSCSSWRATATTAPTLGGAGFNWAYWRYFCKASGRSPKCWWETIARLSRAGG